MANLELSEKELQEFIAEIEKEDDDIIEAGEEAERRLEELSDFDEPDEPEGEIAEERLTDGAWTVDKLPTINSEGKYEGTYVLGAPVFTTSAENPRHSSEYMERLVELGKEGLQRKRYERKQRKINIQRLAFSQELIVMSDTIPLEHLQLLIASLVKEHTRMIDKYKEYIDRRFTRILRPLIPRPLLRVYRDYPYSVHKCPGFLYTASKEFGKGLPYWARPDVPYYFEQGSEVHILREYGVDYLFSIDYSIERLHYHQNERRVKELAYAEKLIRRRNFTYFSLLKLNPFWWEHLYNLLKEKHEYNL